ncbi:MAG: Fe-S cluster assembly protein SufD [Candidatus Krumholzibacteria bacterium]|nr:Fe-S cluster assembly protein SufD [Candidatus Krumholzibacteria bacterium]MDP6669237.1 Fe-S cluster assembly protein SufD [Candidatus Krumholzibacteria bacterium]MDP6798028.1 Fe-S cluster assembly protein SufD [Candidatus Krumholzibacteria bacterium]MDP7021941.1 Fe-S cluster assembly protein SufD [Candidatus Krumholzibacteria bacterium]
MREPGYFEGHFEAFLKTRNREASWIREIRAAGMAHFRELGFPKGAEPNEDCHTLPSAPAELDPARLDAWKFGDSHLLVFLDGSYREELSSPGELPPGVKVGSLRRALSEGNLAPWFGERCRPEREALVALNTAFFDDGAYLHLPRNLSLEKPVHLLFLGSPGKASFPRTLVRLEKGASLQLVECSGSLNGESHFSNAVTEISCASGSRLDHYRIRRENLQAEHYSWTGVGQSHGSRYRSYEVSLGGAKLHSETFAQLEDTRAECQLDGLYLASGKQRMKHRSRVEHLSPDCKTREHYRGILNDKANAAFQGLILVEQGAQHTVAEQKNRNLLLSENAIVESRPELEIHADDVQCSHGSTTGQLDPAQIFFLRSRGIGEETARALLTYAFASEVLDRMELEPLRQTLSAELRRRLPRGETIEASL